LAKVSTNNSTHLAFLPTNIILNMVLFLTNSHSFHWKLVLVTAATRGSEVKGFYPMICNNLGVVLRRGDKKCKESAGFGLARNVLNIS